MNRIKWVVLVLLASFLGACAPASLSPATTPLAAGQRAAAAGKDLDVAMAADALLPPSPPASCPVTQSPEPAFVPPAPYSATPYAGAFWYGTPALWTALPDSGAWADLPYDASGYVQKLFWWRDGYDWQAKPEPALTVTTTRLDAEVTTQPITAATNGWNEDTLSFMLTGGDFPTAGCWQVTGRYGTDELSYVVWIAP